MDNQTPNDGNTAIADTPDVEGGTFNPAWLFEEGDHAISNPGTAEVCDHKGCVAMRNNLKNMVTYKDDPRITQLAENPDFVRTCAVATFLAPILGYSPEEAALVLWATTITALDGKLDPGNPEAMRALNLPEDERMKQVLATRFPDDAAVVLQLGLGTAQSPVTVGIGVACLGFLVLDGKFETVDDDDYETPTGEAADILAKLFGEDAEGTATLDEVLNAFGADDERDA